MYFRVNFVNWAMAFNEEVAQHIRLAFKDMAQIFSKRKMFMAMYFMANEKVCNGTHDGRL